MRGNGMPNINRSLCRLLCCCKSLPKKKHPGLNGFWQAKLRYENEISPTMVNWYASHRFYVPGTHCYLYKSNTWT
ncbi:uncharacterized protein LOC118503115 isoform X3 [Anopheles stephensi]|uniref:uncharacterized protein LOC118503115 isoform X3 n=1 Tax=Anopheles stephensi TaxID=30069 RepID=UPI0016589B89|nr:uncharacterized protein LOC118503115 isoform X3 [Anopheles stephensi]